MPDRMEMALKHKRTNVRIVKECCNRSVRFLYSSAASRHPAGVVSGPNPRRSAGLGGADLLASRTRRGASLPFLWFPMRFQHRGGPP